MTLDAHVTGIWCGQIGGGVGNPQNRLDYNLNRHRAQLSALHVPTNPKSETKRAKHPGPA